MRENRALPPAMEMTTTEVCQPVTREADLHPQHDDVSRRHTRKQRRHGSELIEFTLVFLPFLAFMSLIVNLGWAVYTRATLQYAVAQGVRYAITSGTVTGMGLRASVQTFVQQSAIGLLLKTPGAATGVNGWNYIYVDYYQVNGDGTLTSLDGVNGAAWQAAFQSTTGNLPLVEVSVQNKPTMFLMQFVQLPGMGVLSPIQGSAAAWDRMGSPPLTSAGVSTEPPQ
jgi:Flp pilus assembly protein TadG